MSNTKIKLPRYFVVDFETYVKIEQIGDEITGVNQFGNPYPPIKALYDGQEISEDQFAVASKASKKFLQS